ncbi:acetylornithine deacetylase [Lentilactobacillus kefiri]|uniref:Probable succinyl-diaminopimelate desuccinylase n=1 Tax=Lentilactobacillus kefiri TaxID=33962 RepID=A0A511DXV7_LENKE|nr:acetylornithine deacetylase [Lentilactobacillus kefiri]GEL27988.1 acetylornithine deacetylase [Lentilactobacillus kefiri]
MASKADLLQAVDDHQNELLALLDRLVSFETMSPPARNTAAIQQFTDAELTKVGFETKRVPFYKGDELLSAEKVGTDAESFHSLLLNGHVDVATVDRDSWDTDPFKVTQKGDLLFGRGVSDMKGGVASFMYIFTLLHKLGIELPGNLKFQSVVGEEAGEAGTKTLLKNGEKADFAVVGDTSNMNFQGQGGVITGWITLKSPHIYHDGNRAAMITTGGGLKAANMIEKMMVVIQALEKLERYWGITKRYPGFAPGIDTINPAYIEGGLHPAYIPSEAKLWITVHFYPNENVDDITQEIEKQVIAAAKADPWLRDNLPTFKWGGDSLLADKGEVFPSLELDPDYPGMKALEKSYADIVKAKPIVGMSPSVSDSGWFGYYHIPAVDFGPGTMEQAHSDNESLSLKQLMEYTKIMAAFIFDWCHTKGEQS